MQNWLLKSEPTTWSFDQQKKQITTSWDGVRNYQACNFMKIMELGDLCLFYHSNIGKEIVGITEVVRTFYPDHTDASGRFGMVDVAYHSHFKYPVSLQSIKKEPDLEGLYLVRQPRLSVMPISAHEWQIIMKMAENPSS